MCICWGIQTRTETNRTKICCANHYTISQYIQLLPIKNWYLSPYAEGVRLELTLRLLTELTV